MDRREAAQDALVQGEHPCQTRGHVYTQRMDTDEVGPCAVCGQDPEEEEGETEREQAVTVLAAALVKAVDDMTPGVTPSDLAGDLLDALNAAGFVVAKAPW